MRIVTLPDHDETRAAIKNALLESMRRRVVAMGVTVTIDEDSLEASAVAVDEWLSSLGRGTLELDAAPTLEDVLEAIAVLGDRIRELRGLEVMVAMGSGAVAHGPQDCDAACAFHYLDRDEGVRQYTAERHAREAGG